MFRDAFRPRSYMDRGSLRMSTFLWAAFMILFVAAWVNGALAHSWYPRECCSDRDCYPVPVERVKTVPGGWLIEDGTFVPYSKARPSPDGQYHICRREDGKGQLIELEGLPSCFWAPMGAS